MTFPKIFKNDLVKRQKIRFLKDPSGQEIQKETLKTIGEGEEGSRVVSKFKNEEEVNAGKISPEQKRILLLLAAIELLLVYSQRIYILL